MEALKEIIAALNNISSIGLVALLLIVVFFAIKDPTFLKLIFKKAKQNRELAGLTFEERIAFVENKTLQLEGNHIEHIREDIANLRIEVQELRQDVNKNYTDISRIGERVARVEGRLSI